jgi:hypothetical protein
VRQLSANYHEVLDRFLVPAGPGTGTGPVEGFLIAHPVADRAAHLMADVGPPGTKSKKVVHLRIDPNDESMTLADVLAKIPEIQKEHPDREVFWDGDEYAICSLPKRLRAPPSTH